MPMETLSWRTTMPGTAWRGELPAGFSEKAADKVLGGLIAAATSLAAMPVG